MKKAVPVEDTANREWEKISLHAGAQAYIPVFLSGVMILAHRLAVIRSQVIYKYTMLAYFSCTRKATVALRRQAVYNHQVSSE